MQHRQVGSTIKPFLYTLALQEGMKPCDKILNAPVTIEQPEINAFWSPKNSEETRYDGKEVTMMFALATSLDWTAARLMKQYKPRPMIDLVRKMGVKSEIPVVPSICLGTMELTLPELIGAYTTFANKGVYTQPIIVSRIEDKNGNVLTTVKPQQNEAISENTAYTMVRMLQQVVVSGTGNRLRSKYNLTNEIGGKTGTTDNHSDGWFVGVTPDLVAGAWVGGEEPTIHFDHMKSGEGAAMALPIFGLFMQKVYADPRINLYKGPFPAPVNYDVPFDCSMREVEETDTKGSREDSF
jgi:penicillin-binding protein 1A